MDEKREWVRKLQEEAEIPEIVQQKAEQAFEMVEERERSKRSLTVCERKRTGRPGRKKTAVLILAAALLVSTLTVGAAAYFHWDNKLSERYQVTPEIEKKLNDANAAKELSQAVEHDGLRIEAVQSVADSNLAIVVLKVTGDDDIVFDNFEKFDFQVEGNDEISWNGGILEGTFREGGRNGFEYEITLQDTGEKGILNRKASLSFINAIDSYTGKSQGIESPVTREGTWTIELNLDNEDSMQRCQVNQKIPGSEAVVREFRFSSISYIIDMDWKKQMETLPYVDENGEKSTFEHLVYPPMLTGVVYEDGSTVIAGVSGNSRFVDEAKTKFRMYGQFFPLIDPARVKELIFSDGGELSRVPLKEMPPEQKER